MRKVGGRSQLFTLRIWPETRGNGDIEWRGKVQRVADGETLYFRNWSDLHEFVFGSVEAQGRWSAGEQIEIVNDGEGRNDGREEL